MIEMILAHLCDEGSDFSDYPGGAAALLHLHRAQQLPRADRLRRLLRAVDGRHVHRTGADHRSGERREQRQPALYRSARPTRSSMPRSMPATPSTRRSPRRRSRRRSTTGRRSSVPHSRCETTMSTAIQFPTPTTFTVTHARHMAAKVATDLKRMQRLYGSPSDAEIADYEAEADRAAEGRLSRHRDLRLSPQRRLDRADAALHGAGSRGAAANDDDPGRIRPGANIAGATLLHLSDLQRARGTTLTAAEQSAFKTHLAVSSRRRAGARRQRIFERRPRPIRPAAARSNRASVRSW